MHGNGIKPDLTKSEIDRTAPVGSDPSGQPCGSFHDRCGSRGTCVFTALLAQQGPFFGLVRSSVGFLLLDRAGCAVLDGALETGVWGAPDWIARLRKRPAATGGAEAMLRQVAVARCLPHRLSRMLAGHLPKGIHYINVGHTNLTERVIHAVRGVQDAKIAVLIHDTIPLDFPQFQRPESPDRFRAFLTRASQHADLFICISECTRSAISHHIPVMPPAVVAHLGLGPMKPETPPDGPWRAPYFVTLGTIEPRKNHQLLLDIWPKVTDAHLVICGQRGWQNADVFARLDRGIDRVHEVSHLSDFQIHGLLQGAAGFLFPSLAEGYGLPPVEAAALGTPVICNDLPVFREILGEIPVYAPADDPYAWITAINRLTTGKKTCSAPFVAPEWDIHFDTVFAEI